MALNTPSAVEICDRLATLAPAYQYEGAGQWSRHLDGYSRTDIDWWTNREVMRCRTSPAYFLASYCATVAIPEGMGALGGGTVTLMPTDEDWPHMRALIAAFWPPRDIVIEKSRQMLASWFAMAVVLHDLLFRSDWAVLTLSRVEKLVDDGGERSTPATLHGKVRFMWEHLPEFLRAEPLLFKHLSIVNPAHNAYALGFSSTPAAGRGPTFSRAILDEFAHVPFSEQVLTSVARACPTGKVLISTPHGKANAFARVRFHASRQVFPRIDAANGHERASTEEGGRHWERYSIHWSQHPQRDRAWYDAIVASHTMTAEAIAQELDISYERSLVGRVYPKFVYDLHVAGGALALCVAPLSVQPNRPLYLCCDFNVDPLVWLIVQPYPERPFWRVVSQICRRNATLEDGWNEFILRYAGAPVVHRLLHEHPDWEERYGAQGVMVCGEGGHQADLEIYGDATEEKRTLYSRVKAYAMISSALRQASFRPKLCVPPSNPPIRVRHETMNDALSRNLVLCDPSCEELIKDWESGVWDGSGRDMEQRTADDDASGLTRSHASAALGYLLCRKHRVGMTTGTPKAAVRQQDVAALIDRW